MDEVAVADLDGDNDVDIILGLLPPGTAADGPEGQEIIDAIDAVNDSHHGRVFCH